MPLLSTILILLVTARLFGRLSVRVGQPAIVGEIIAGLLLGPAILKLITPTPELSAISELAVFLIILGSGLEMDFKEVVQNLRGKGLLVAAISFFIPLLAGVGIGAMFDMDAMRTLFLGLSLSITALPVAVRMLESLNLQKTAIARFSIGSAIFSDIAALLILGIILRIPGEAEYSEIGKSVAITGSKLLAFGICILVINYFLQLLSSPGHRLHGLKERLFRLTGTEGMFGITALFVLAFSSVSEALGFHFVIGAFFGALLLNHDLFGEKRFAEIEKTVSSISDGFLAPLFFAALGLQLNVISLDYLGLIAAVLVAAVLSKLFAGVVGGRIVGLSRQESWKMGCILNGRGVMGIVVAEIALQHKFISEDLFAILILMSVATTSLTPILAKSKAKVE